MAYRGVPLSPTSDRSRPGSANDSSPPPPAAAAPASLAAQAIRASSAHRDSSLSSAYGESAIAYARRESDRQRTPSSPQEPAVYEYTSMKSLSENEPRSGFWTVLARKAKAILDDEHTTQQFETHERIPHQMADTSKSSQIHQSDSSAESHQKPGTPSFERSSETFASSLNYIGGTIKNALEEGLTIVENRTADIIQETRKLRIRRKGSGSNQAMDKCTQHTRPRIQTDLETQLKASRDVANAMSAKAKLLLRELKTVKADLAFAKERCAQLEEENKLLRESRGKGNSREDDDLIRLQLETLLAEKGRLANENSVFARENRFLREIVEYHQLTMQDVVYVDEGIEEVTEVCPIQFPWSDTSYSPTIHNLASSTPLTSPVVLRESCPIVPTPPMQSPSRSQSFKEFDSSRGETGLQSPPASEDAKQQC